MTKTTTLENTKKRLALASPRTVAPAGDAAQPHSPVVGSPPRARSGGCDGVRGGVRWVSGLASETWEGADPSRPASVVSAVGSGELVAGDADDVARVVDVHVEVGERGDDLVAPPATPPIAPRLAARAARSCMRRRTRCPPRPVRGRPHRHRAKGAPAPSAPHSFVTTDLFSVQL